MKLHGDLMNINVDSNKRESVIADSELDNYGVYNRGHRDARHQAAEASLKWDRYIELLENHLEDVDGLIDDLRKEAGV